MSFNFALILFWLMVFTGAVWLADLLILKRRRETKAAAALAQFDATSQFQEKDANLEDKRRALRDSILRQPAWIEFPAGFFPVILVVFLLRSFLFEPFRIPSGSMIPTLQVGDLILVNKFSYGIRLPIVNTKIIDSGHPERGDVMVFRFPKDPSIDYIKRVIGVPGDRIVYRNKKLEINGVAVPEEALPDYFDSDRVLYSKQFRETLPSSGHEVSNNILNDDDHSPVIVPDSYPNRDNCVYSENDTVLSCTVPAGNYFMMGDNRDNSEDSRYWGFVPDQNIVGKAFFIWMNFGNIKRIGSFQ
jgi:signal peptidase I